MIDTVIPALIMVVIWVGGPIIILLTYERLQQKDRSMGCFAALLLTFLTAFALVVFFTCYPSDFEHPIFMALGLLMAPVLIGGVLLNKMLAPPPGIEGLDLDSNAPEMVAATQQARATFGYFVQQVEKHAGGALIRFQRVIAGNVKERVWAHVCCHEAGVFHVSLPTPYLRATPVTEMDVPETDVEDWMIVLPDGTVKGGFSIIAAIRRLEKNGQKLNKTVRKQKQALIDFDRPAAS